jgi:hypothetical protein
MGLSTRHRWSWGGRTWVGTGFYCPGHYRLLRSSARTLLKAHVEVASLNPSYGLKEWHVRLYRRLSLPSSENSHHYIHRTLPSLPTPRDLSKYVSTPVSTQGHLAPKCPPIHHLLELQPTPRSGMSPICHCFKTSPINFLSNMSLPQHIYTILLFLQVK